MSGMPANLESLNVGDVLLSKYEIRGLVGRGGQATVYHSYDTFIDRDVAIKIMSDASDARREHSRRAQMEARVLCRLQHKNIVHVYDAGMLDNGTIYIIMELLKGRTLREVLRDHRRLTVYEALLLGAQIADGVEVAHRQQVIHRDLKPENIFVVDGNVVKVLDFGIAKFLTLTGITTQRDTLQGTMWYISPEHVQGFGVTARSDIYALGSILYEIICGTPPCLIGLQEVSTQAVAWSQISRLPPQLDELMPGEVPSHVGRLIQRMLVKDPKERPATMADVAEALRNACERLNVEARNSTVLIRELWNEVAELGSAKGGTLVLSPNSNIGRARNPMQATIEVRRRESHVPAASQGDVQGVAVPVESGFIMPQAAPNVEQFTEAAVPTLASAVAAQAVGSASNSSGESVLPAVASSDMRDGLPARKSALLNRPLLVTAVVLGTGFGLAVGLFGHLSSKSAEPPASALPPAAVASITDQKREPAPVQVKLPTTEVHAASIASAIAAAASASAHPAPSKEVAAPRVAPHPVSALRIAPSPVASAARSNNASGGPKPRYTVDDLE